MALKNQWTDKIDNQDIVYAEDINSIAHAVIELEDSGGAFPGTFTETVTEMTMTLPQISAGEFSSISQDYNLVYTNSIIVIDVIDCVYNEGGDLVGLPVVFSVLPKYENYQKVEGVKRIFAFRMGTSSAKIDITLKIHEIQCP